MYKGCPEITYIFRHDGVDLHPIVQESHTTLSINSHSSYILNPMPMLNGVWIQEGSLLGWLYALGTSVWRFFSVVAVAGGVWAPFLDAVPSLPFNCGFSLKVFMSRQLWTKCSGLLQ